MEAQEIPHLQTSALEEGSEVFQHSVNGSPQKYQGCVSLFAKGTDRALFFSVWHANKTCQASPHMPASLRRCSFLPAFQCRLAPGSAKQCPLESLAGTPNQSLHFTVGIGLLSSNFWVCKSAQKACRSPASTLKILIL